MEIETRMGFKVRSKYEDIVAWIQSDPPGVAYPRNRKELQLMDSHLYAQLTAALSTEATLTVADDFYRGRGGGGGRGPPGGKGDKGDKGDGGDRGPDGRSRRGTDGKDGTPGTDGKNWKDGKAGKDGRDGKDGDKGDPGDSGPPGPRTTIVDDPDIQMTKTTSSPPIRPHPATSPR